MMITAMMMIMTTLQTMRRFHDLLPVAGEMKVMMMMIMTTLQTTRRVHDLLPVAGEILAGDEDDNDDNDDSNDDATNLETCPRLTVCCRRDPGR